MTDPHPECPGPDQIRQAIDSLTSLFMVAYEKDPDRAIEVVNDFMRRGKEITERDTQ